MTRAQKLLRPFINWLVERFFHDSMFYGNELPTKWGADSPMQALVCETAALSLAVQCYLARVNGMTVDITGASYKGEGIGDWQVAIKRTAKNCGGNQ